MKKPELLAPGGSLEKLKTAIDYGADAVYIGGEMFSLRVAAENFSKEDMQEGIKYADDRGKKVYLTANILPHNDDIEEFEEFVKDIKNYGFDAVLVADLGLFDMMQELADIKANIQVDATILIVDAMTGQDAVNVASTFADKVGIDGVILTKMDGDTRGGAALSIKAVTGKPILYVGMGEKLSDLEQFYPDRMANRILGMGDVLSLIEKAQENISIDENREKEMAARMKKGKFDFDDYLESMKQMRNMGGLSSILSMMPGMGGKLGDVESMIDEKQLARTEAIILSMTPEERKNPKLMNLSRKGRIAKGAGVDIAVVNRFIKQFEQSQKMMKQMPGLMGGKRGRGMFGGMKFPF